MNTDAIKFNNINMQSRIIKIVFSTKSNDDIPWCGYEQEIMNGIHANKQSYIVSIKNCMPISELNNIIQELCNKIEYKLGYITKHYHNDECFTNDSYNISEITYYIELK